MKEMAMKQAKQVKQAMAAEDDLIQLATRIPKSSHRALRIFCVEAGITVMAFVISAVDEKLARVGAKSGKLRRAA